MSESNRNDSKKTSKKKARKKAGNKKAAAKQTAGKSVGDKLTKDATSSGVAADKKTVKPKSSESSAADTAHSESVSNASNSEVISNTAAGAKSSNGLLRGLHWVLLFLVIGVLVWLLFVRGWWQSNPDGNSQQVEQLQSSLSEQNQRLESLQNRQLGLDNRLDTLSNDLAGRAEFDPDTMQQRIDAAGQSQFDRLQSEQRQQLSQLNERLAQIENATDQGLGRIRQQQQSIVLQQRLAETASLLRYARQQLVLGNNQRAALNAYQLAQHNLQSVSADDPLDDIAGIVELRRQLANEQAALAAVESTSVELLVNELHAMVDSVDGWSLRSSSGEPTEKPVQPDQDAGWWQKLRNSAGSLVRVRRNDDVRLSLDEQAMVRRQVQLQLQTLGLLALQQRQQGFSEGLTNLQGFIERWFETESGAAARALQQLNALQQSQLAPQWPSLGESLEQLQQLRGNLENRLNLTGSSSPSSSSTRDDGAS